MPISSRYVDPTPEEIAAECEKIQAEWSEEERLKRGGSPRQPVQVRVMALQRGLPTQLQWGRNS